MLLSRFVLYVSEVEVVVVPYDGDVVPVVVVVPLLIVPVPVVLPLLFIVPLLMVEPLVEVPAGDVLFIVPDELELSVGVADVAGVVPEVELVVVPDEFVVVLV